MHDPRAAARTHEPYDFSARRVAWTAAALAAIVLLLSAAVHLGIGAPRSAQRNAHWIDDRRRAPELQNAPLDDLARYERDKRAQLDGYRWIDRDAGIIHIPIEQAMRISAARSNAEQRR